jgi:acetyl-CoA C-acetyltransferase
MALDPRTPVLVGTAAASQRGDDPTQTQPLLDLIARAAEGAASDAGNRDLLRSLDAVIVPRGSWSLPNVPGALAASLGSPKAHSIVAELGILQTTLFARAAGAIASGTADVVLVAGGETKWRELRATIGSIDLASVDAGGASDAAPEPDEYVRPDGMIIAREEVNAGLVTAVSHYSMIENALRAAAGQTLDAHAVEVAELWSRFNAVAVANPDAWNRTPMSADQIREPSPKNRPLAFPYNKWHNSQWNVDQAAALVLCSVEAARRFGISEDRWVFPHAIAESQLMVPVSQRAQIHRSPGFAIAGARALDAAGIGVADIAHVDLYSCFPAAVRVQVAELGLDPSRQLTVTGGMTFGGGPLNNYVLQSTTRMAHVLRDDPGSIGLVTAISGMITKQGVSLWSTRPPESGYRGVDVTDEVAAHMPVVPTAAPDDADATIATYTVLFGEDGPAKAAAVVDRGDGTRSVATSEDREMAQRMVTEEMAGRAVHLTPDGRFSLL